MLVMGKIMPNLLDDPVSTKRAVFGGPFDLSTQTEGVVLGSSRFSTGSRRDLSVLGSWNVPLS
jgi:hypothetical protein